MEKMLASFQTNCNENLNKAKAKIELAQEKLSEGDTLIVLACIRSILFHCISALKEVENNILFTEHASPPDPI